MKSVRILLADDHPVVRRGLRTVLAGDSCGEAAGGKDAVLEAKRLRPDVVVLDINMTELNGFEASRQILKAIPQANILFFTMDGTEPAVRKALNAGAKGLVSQSDPDGDLLEAIEALSQNQTQTFLSPRVLQLLLQGYVGRDSNGVRVHPRGRLTLRQQQIVRLLASGKYEQGSGDGTWDQRQNSRNSSDQYHGEARPSLVQ